MGRGRVVVHDPLIMLARDDILGISLSSIVTSLSIFNLPFVHLNLPFLCLSLKS
jgi:hypothetical protein